jgi:hypothetical protein
MSRECNMNGEKMNAYGILVVNPERKRAVGRPNCRWVRNTEMDLREIGWGDMD